MQPARPCRMPGFVPCVQLGVVACFSRLDACCFVSSESMHASVRTQPLPSSLIATVPVCACIMHRELLNFLLLRDVC
jgi:hypothetical protein